MSLKVADDDTNDPQLTDAESEVAMEIHFRLDQYGRTTPILQGNDSATAREQLQLDYTTRVVSTHFETLANDRDDGTTTFSESSNSTKSDSTTANIILDDVLLDCDIADCSIMPRTFWIDHTHMPRCNLEQMAYDILNFYCPPSNESKPAPAICGAEWWVQIRPAPDKISRYSVLNSSSNDNVDPNYDANETEANHGVSFHWDKDEDLRLLCNGTVYVHPHLSTVTYLTENHDTSAPTFIAEEFRVHNLTGEWIVPEQPLDGDKNAAIDNKHATASSPDMRTSKSSAFLSWPALGKHLCFDGRYLHAAPSNLQKNSHTKLNLTPDILSDEDSATNVKTQRRSRRYTFLVNIWIHHKPLNVHPFPESMIDKMSGYISRNSLRIRLILEKSSPDDKASSTNHENGQHQHMVSQVTTVIVKSDTTVQILDNLSSIKTSLPVYDRDAFSITNRSLLLDKNEKVQEFIWPMGDHTSGESIHAHIPLETVQSKSSTGGNVRIVWCPSKINTSYQERFGMFLDKRQPKCNSCIDNTTAGGKHDSKRTRVE
jgi:hypothetical protein